MYALAMTIDYRYWEWDCKCHYARQVEKEALESHFWKQGKASTSSSAMAFQNKTNTPLATLFAKNSSSKSSLFPTPQVDLSSKLASNSKLTSDKCKKCLKNNLYLYCGIEDHKLDSYPKKQTTVSPKGYSALVPTDTLAAASEKLSEK